MVEMLPCPKCFKKCPVDKPMGEELWVKVPTGELVGLDRRFWISCSEHGRLLVSAIGHHSTLSKKQLRGLFPKKIAMGLKKLLPPDEGKKFSNSLNGLHHPTSEDVARWQELSKQVGAE